MYIHFYNEKKKWKSKILDLSVPTPTLWWLPLLNQANLEMASIQNQFIESSKSIFQMGMCRLYGHMANTLWGPGLLIENHLCIGHFTMLAEKEP